MTPKMIVEQMIRDKGLPPAYAEFFRWLVDSVDGLVEAAVAEEREACAKVAEAESIGSVETQHSSGWRAAASSIAGDIRARGST